MAPLERTVESTLMLRSPPTYLTSLEATVIHGPGLAHRLEMRPGGYLYISPNAPHGPINPSATRPSSPCWHSRTPTSRRA
jgi:uncharacterized RmlC-like cupin family protein